jgi:hypothetical protein
MPATLLTAAGHRSVQRLQFFLPESRRDPGQVNTRMLELLLPDPATRPSSAERAWSSMTDGIARTAPRPRTWGISGILRAASTLTQRHAGPAWAATLRH